MTDGTDVGDGESRGSPGPRVKVARLIDRHGLVGYGADLEARWTDPEDDWSLRGLATWFNTALVGAHLDEAGVPHTRRDPGETYRRLTDEDATEGERREVEARLVRDGVDVETLRDEFVSHQAVHTYLRKHRGASAPSVSDEEQLARDRERLERLRSRAVAVTEETVDRLQRTDRLTLGTFSAFVDVQVLCEGCGRQYEVSDLIEAGGCDCR
ncbi:rod-determining factor RdfA [Halomarina ordinaria]|uniref:Rod-determining factor RdfA n=1 Tax=Halomarina ordinaria TaxID=3033939 RepID=A0ABD5UCR8_9EURY|nr:rod-determining factor RdfA [Halomarina sp. PSRA2]